MAYILHILSILVFQTLFEKVKNLPIITNFSKYNPKFKFL